MTTLHKITVNWQEDGSATVLARVCADDATGQATGVKGEGYFVKIADLSTITCKVFDMSEASPTNPRTPITTPMVTISTSVLDTPVTDGILWDVDDVGYNFKFR